MLNWGHPYSPFPKFRVYDPSENLENEAATSNGQMQSKGGPVSIIVT